MFSGDKYPEGLVGPCQASYHHTAACDDISEVYKGQYICSSIYGYNHEDKVFVM